MPIYEYDCPDCGRFEVMESASAKPLAKCPQCQEKGKKNKVQRVMSASAFHLKGGGWYKTDYASGGSTSGGSVKSNSESSTEASVGNSDASAPATSAEKAPEKSSEKNTEKSEKKKSSLKAAGSCGGNCACH